MMRDDSAAYRNPPTIQQIWRTVVEQVWRVEHAFERSRMANRAVDDTRVRIFGVLTLFALGFVFLAVKAGAVALFSHPEGYGFEAPAPVEQRADLVDRNGMLLALDVPHYGVYVDSRDIWDVGEARRGLSAVLPSVSRQRMDKALISGRRELLMNGLTAEQRDRVHDLGLPGVSFEEEARRSYPLGQQAAHIIGFADPSGKGLAGAERGLDGVIREAAPGRGAIATSIDLRVQGALESELHRAMVDFNAQNAVGIVTNINTGEVLALSSLPDFDPNKPSASDPTTLVNHAGSSLYEMGSTFKMFTFAMALDSHAVDLNTSIDATHPLHLGPRVIHDFHATNERLSAEEVFLHSSNIGTARIALMAGQDKMYKYFKSFGLFDPAKIELAESARPIVPKDWSESTMASVSFGANISVTPLAVAQAMGGVFNGGRMVPLTIRKRQPSDQVETRQVVSPETSLAMLGLMRQNVLRGTGGKADAPGLRVGGKTGSAEKPEHGVYARNKLVTSFAAIFPTDGPVGTPRYLVLIMLDEPKGTPAASGQRTAGWNSAPTAGRVIDRIAPFVGVARAKTQVQVAHVTAPTINEEESAGAQ